MFARAVLPLSPVGAEPPYAGELVMRTPEQVRRAKRRTLAVMAVAVAVLGLWVRDEMSRPEMRQVVASAWSPMPLSATQATARTVDGIVFPDWSRWGWQPTGGRADTLSDHRTAATTRYERGDEVVTFTIVSGTDNVDDGQIWPFPAFAERDGEKVELGESRASFSLPTTSGTVVTVKRHVRDRTVVLTGSPATQGVMNQLDRLALRDVPAQQHATD